MSGEKSYVTVYENEDGMFSNSIEAGKHLFLADEPQSVPGGKDTGPNPYDYLLAALGACTSMTLRMYANHKKIPLEHVRVILAHCKIHADDCTDCPKNTEGYVDVIEKEIELTGKDLTPDQRKRLIEIADKCPVHKTLNGTVQIQTKEVV